MASRIQEHIFNLERFKLEKFLGRGSYGEVNKYSLKDTEVERKEEEKNVAVKKLGIPADAEDFDVENNREIQIMLNLKHPNIIRFLGYCRVDFQIALVMELCICDLDKLIGSQREFDENEVAFLVNQICRGLAYLHENCIIHRDIKPGNILMKCSNEIDFKAVANINEIVLKISDFGLSKQLAENATSVTMTVAGSPLYKAPELRDALTRNLHYSMRSDVYSLGLVAYNLLHKDLQTLHPGSKGLGAAVLELKKEKLTTPFNSFLSACLQHQSDKRDTSAKLLQHPLLEKASLEEFNRLALQRQEEKQKEEIKKIAVEIEWQTKLQRQEERQKEELKRIAAEREWQTKIKAEEEEEKKANFSRDRQTEVLKQLKNKQLQYELFEHIRKANFKVNRNITAIHLDDPGLMILGLEDGNLEVYKEINKKLLLFVTKEMKHGLQFIDSNDEVIAVAAEKVYFSSPMFVSILRKNNFDILHQLDIGTTLHNVLLNSKFLVTEMQTKVIVFSSLDWKMVTKVEMDSNYQSILSDDILTLVSGEELKQLRITSTGCNEIMNRKVIDDRRTQGVLSCITPDSSDVNEFWVGTSFGIIMKVNVHRREVVYKLQGEVGVKVMQVLCLQEFLLCRLKQSVQKATSLPRKEYIVAFDMKSHENCFQLESHYRKITDWSDERSNIIACGDLGFLGFNRNVLNVFTIDAVRGEKDMKYFT